MPVCLQNQCPSYLITFTSHQGWGSLEGGKEDERMLRTGRGRWGGWGGREGEGHGDVGSAQPGQSIPVSVCFLLPIPSFLGEKRVCTTMGGLEQRSPQPPPCTPKGQPSLCLLPR